MTSHKMPEEYENPYELISHNMQSLQVSEYQDLGLKIKPKAGRFSDLDGSSQSGNVLQDVLKRDDKTIVQLQNPFSNAGPTIKALYQQLTQPFFAEKSSNSGALLSSRQKNNKLTGLHEPQRSSSSRQANKVKLTAQQQ